MKSIRQSKRPLSVSFHPNGWGLEQDARVDRWRFGRCPAEVIDDFKSVASVCAVALGAENNATAWVEWLEHLRRDSGDFPKGDEIAVSQHEQRPNPDAEIAVRGLVNHIVEVRPADAAETISIPFGEIDDACAMSERFCRLIADEAEKHLFALPLDVPSTERPPQPAADGGVTSTDASRSLTLREASRALHLSKDTLLRMRKRGEIKMFKPHGSWRVLASEIVRIREQPKYRDR